MITTRQTIVIDCERYGERTQFESLEEAQDSIRQCGPEFEQVTLTANGSDIYDDRNLVVGYLLGSGTITWYEDDSSGRGYYRIDYYDDSWEDVPAPSGPITARSDSDWIANLFGLEIVSVYHDGNQINVTFRI